VWGATSCETNLVIASSGFTECAGCAK